MNGLRVSKQQFVETMERRYRRLYCKFPKPDILKKVREGAEMDFDRIDNEGFVLVDHEKLIGQLTSGSPRAHLKNKLIQEILGSEEQK